MVSFPSIKTVFIFHLLTSYIMLGIVFLTQVITYPMYQILPPDTIIIFQSAYILRAFFVMGPIMVLELLTGIRLVIKVTDLSLHSLIRSDLAILFAIWVITLAFEFPLHLDLLKNGYSPQTFRSIMAGNITRLVLWIVKCWFVTRMIPYFYAYDTVFDYQELS